MNLTVVEKDLTGNLRNYQQAASDVCVDQSERTVEFSAAEVFDLLG